MQRYLTAELLDALPPDDPGAQRSRRDLCWLNARMGHARAMSKTLRAEWSRLQPFPQSGPRRLLDVGAGDGMLMLSVARRLAAEWPGLEVLLLDRHDLLSRETSTAFAGLGWQARAVVGDVIEGLSQPAEAVDIIVANLFLHHFSERDLRRLLAAAAEKCRLFIAYEPRRSRWALFFARQASMFCCGAVTQHDAPASVEAGFNGGELSALWTVNGWHLSEGRSGWFSHRFVARRVATLDR